MTTLHSTFVPARRIGPTLVPDRSRVLMRPFRPTTEEIARRIVAQVMALSEADIASMLRGVLADFEDRHHAVEKFFHNRFANVRPLIDGQRKALIETAGAAWFLLHPRVFAGVRSAL